MILLLLVSAALVAILSVRRGRDVQGFERVAWCLVPIGVFAIGLTYWAAIRLVPHWTWSAARLAASARLAYGFPLYTPPEDPAVNGWIYGPVSAIAYLPSMAVRDPLGALRIATGLNALYFLLPPIVLFAGELRARAQRGSQALVLLFCLAALIFPFGTWYGAAALGSDTVAVCLGVLSCVCLVRRERLPLAALLCALATWTKQIEAPLALAQLGFLWRARGGPVALAYFKWLVVAVALTTAVFAAWFGPEEMWHCMFVIPGRHPLLTTRMLPHLAAFAWATWWTWPLALLALRRQREPVASADPQRAIGLLLLLAAAILLPSGLAAASKAGGDQNSLHAISYAVLGGAALLGCLVRDSRRDVVRLARMGLVAGCALVTAANLRRIFVHDHLAISDPGMQHREAVMFARGHPGQVYFPCNPLVTLMVERRDYPFDYGLYDWKLARQQPELRAMRALFPATLTFIVYHEADPSREMRGVFPEFNRLRQVGSWDVFMPAAPGPSK